MAMSWKDRPDARAFGIATALVAVFMLLKAVFFTPGIANLHTHNMVKTVRPLAAQDWTCTDPHCEATAMLNDDSLWLDPLVRSGSDAADLTNFYVFSMDLLLLVPLAAQFAVSLTRGKSSALDGPQG